MTTPSNPLSVFFNNNGQATIYNATASTSTNTGALTVYGGLGVGTNLYTNLATVTNASSATSTTTGALTVAGGMGVGGNVYVSGSTPGDGGSNNGTGSLVYIRQNTTWSGQQPWALYVSGYSYLSGFRINGGDGVRSLFLQSGLLGFATGDASSPITFTTQNSLERMRIDTTGTVYIGTTTRYSGELLAVAGSVYVNGAVTATNIYGISEVAVGTGNYVSLGGPASGTRLRRDASNNGMDLQTSSLSRLFIADTDGSVIVRSVTVSTSTNTGALQVAGGIGVNGQIYAGSSATISVNASVTNNYGSHITLANPTGTQTGIGWTFGGTTKASIRVDNSGNFIINANSNNIYFNNDLGTSASPLQFLFSNNLYQQVLGTTSTFLGNLIANSGTNATSTNTGALQVRGGLGVGGAIYAGQGVNAVGTSSFRSTVTFVSSDLSATIVARMLTSDVLTFSGARGQLFSISDSFTGTIFGVYDISGVPAIEAYDTGNVVLTETFGNVGIGVATTATTAKFTVGGGVSIAGITTITNTSTSLSTGSGALQVQGGVGIWGNLYVGGTLNAASVVGSISTATYANNINITNDTTSVGLQYLTFVSASSGYNTLKTAATSGISYYPNSGNFGIGTSNPGNRLTVYTTATNTDGLILGSSVGGGNVSLRPNQAGGSNNGITQSGDAGIIYSSAAGMNTGGFIIAPWYAGTSGMRFDSSGTVTIPLAQNATSTSTGALRVTGGAGIGTSLYVGSNLVVGTAGNASTLTNIQLAGVLNTFTFVSPNGAGYNVLTTNAALLMPMSNFGFYSIDTAGNARNFLSKDVGGNINLGAAQTSLNGSVNIAAGNSGAVNIQAGLTQNNWLTVNSTGTVAISSNSNSISIVTGALTVAGGIGVSGNLYAGGNVVAYGSNSLFGDLASSSTFNVNATRSLNLIGTAAVMRIARASAGGDPAVELLNLNTTTGAITTWWDLYSNVSDNLSIRRRGTGSNADLFANFTLSGTTFGVVPVTISTWTNATSTTTGALIVTGGVGIGGTLYTTNQVVSGTTNSTTTNTGALQVVGGLGVNGNLNVGGTTSTILGQLGVGPNGTSVNNWYSFTPQLLVNNNQNAATILGIGNGTIGASSYIQVRMIGGTANSYATESLADNNGSPILSYDTGPGVNYRYWSFGGVEKMRLTSSTFRTSVPASVIDTSQTTNTSTGALTVTGGVAVGGNLAIGGYTYYNNLKSAHIFIKGTGLNNNGTNAVYINGAAVNFTSGIRGLTFVTIDKATLTATNYGSYDTYGTVSSSTQLATLLDAMTNTQFGVLLSFDAIEAQINSTLISALARKGLYKLAYGDKTGSRRPYAALFNATGNSGNPSRNVTEVYESSNAYAPQAVISTVITTDGSPQGAGFHGNNLTNVLISGQPDTATPVVIVDQGGGVTINGVTTVTNNTQASSTVSGALQVIGGVGIGGNLWVGGTINATIVGITSTATNIAGGTTGQIPYQTSPGVTSFYGPGTAGQVHVSGGAAAPIYQSTLSLTTLALGTGVNATTPNSLLDMHRAFAAYGIYEASTATFSTDNGSTAWVVGQITGYVAAGPLQGIGNFPGGLAFKTKATDGVPGTVPVTNMVLNAAGNLGIGITDPLSKLHVAGDARVSGVFTSTNATQSNSTITGALILAGGIGVGGNVNINGSLNAITKSFVISHPTKPGMRLRYGSLEGPENGVYIRGRLKGSTTIQLPDYWTKLVDPESITVQITPIGKHQKLYVEAIKDNTVIIENDAMFGGSIDCYYVVFAERADTNKLEVEMPE